MTETAEQKLYRLREHYPTGWMKNHGIKTSTGLPFEFTDHAFMLDPINDMSPLQVWLKPPQIGASEAQIVKTFYCAKNNGWDIIYTLPTQSDVQDMAGGKINRIVAQNPDTIGKWVKDHDTVEQKAVGEHIIHYRGTFSQKQAMMVSSDLNVHDEVDASDPAVILQYETRLQAKADGRRWYFSHPSLAGFGVDIYWQKSDKKEWFVKCPICEKEQTLTFPDNIDPINKCYICSHCKAHLTDDTRRKGEWKPTSKGEFSGYHISQLMCPWISAEKILKDKEEKDAQYFWNYVLGLPYVGSENKIDPSIVMRNVVSEINSQDGQIVIGVDTGLPIHYVIGNKEGIFYYGKCKAPSDAYNPYEELEGFLKRWPKSILVSDQGGDLVGIRQLQAKYPGRVFLCYYRKDRKSTEMIKWGMDKEMGMVMVDRNRMIQMIVEQMRDVGRLRLQGSQDDWKEFASHFGNIYRTIKETPFGNEYVWERNGPDHFVHSFLYLLVGLDRFSENMAKIVGASGFEDIPITPLFAS